MVCLSETYLFDIVNDVKADQVKAAKRVRSRGVGKGVGSRACSLKLCMA